MIGYISAKTLVTKRATQAARPNQFTIIASKVRKYNVPQDTHPYGDLNQSADMFVFCYHPKSLSHYRSPLRAHSIIDEYYQIQQVR